MSIYLHDIPLPEAQARLQDALNEIGLAGRFIIEEIQLNEDSVGRVLGEPVWAKISSPHYNASAMDGFAVRASSTVGAQLSVPLKLSCEKLGCEVQACYLDTGDPLPEWADAVVPIENVEALDKQGRSASDPRHPAFINLRTAATPWQHVRPMGEDMVATQLVLPGGHTLRPVDLGAIAACGHQMVRVVRRPKVAIIPTGSELVAIGKPVRSGEIIEFNSLVLAAQINGWGGVATRYPITPDDFDQLCACVSEAALDHDLVLINAGSSAGSEDYSARVIQTLGNLLVHGVAVRPGHPVILGLLDRSRLKADASSGVDSEARPFIPVIGVPGYPVSAALTGEIFVEPLIARWLGRIPHEPQTIQATLTRKVTSPSGDDDYIRVVLGQVGEKMLAAPLGRGSGVITSLVRADGILILPRGSQGASAGTEVNVRLYRQPDELKRTIFSIGSHDMTLDLMAQYLSGHNRRLVSANVGSLGGLVALSRGEAHMAGSHLLDPQTGEYNLSYIRQYLPGVAVKVIAFVGREQGLIVIKNNPKKIHGLEDIRKPGVRYINRQRGAGTRLLLDYHLDQMRISPDTIQGYEREEYTHLAVAVAIAGDRADCGLGIAAAAQALNLDFIPLFQERYELVIPARYFDSDLFAPLFAILNDPDFQKDVSLMPGYDVKHMGQIVSELV